MDILTPFEISKLDVMKILIYLRKSRAEGKETVEDVLARHERILQDYAIQTFGERIPDRNIHREVVSGETIRERDEIQKVFQRIEKEEIQAILVIEPQRISRGDMSDCGRVVNILKYSETLVLTITKTYDLNNKFDKELFESQLLQGNKYLEYQKEIMERGRQLSLREGKFIGSIAPYGYEREPLSKGFKLKKHPEEGPIVELIFDMYLKQNKTAQDIADHLNIRGITTRHDARWTHQTINSILKLEYYYGAVRWGKNPTIKKLIDGDIQKVRVRASKYTITKGMHEPFVTKEDWDIAQERIKNNTHPNQNNEKNFRNPLRGIIVCAHCGYAITVMVNRPTKMNKRRRVRKYDLDKDKLNSVLREARFKKGVHLRAMAKELGIKEHLLVSWCAPNTDKTYYSDTFDKAWPILKLYLDIETDEFDKAIISAKDPRQLDDLLRCTTRDCVCKMSMLPKIEKQILDDLEDVLKEFKLYVDNYEEEIIRERDNVDKATARLRKKLDALKQERKNLLRAWNREEYSYEDYTELKTDIENEMEIVENDIAILEASEKNDKLIRYKKAIPILDKCLREYDTMTVPEKNEILKALIERVEYSKTTSLHGTSNGIDNTKITTYLKI